MDRGVYIATTTGVYGEVYIDSNVKMDRGDHIEGTMGMSSLYKNVHAYECLDEQYYRYGD
jgi:hypothetical protein